MADLNSILNTKGTTELESVRQAALENDAVLRRLQEGLTSANDVYRYNCFQALLLVTAAAPGRLAPAWDTLVGYLNSENSFHRSIAVHLLANLAEDARFDSIYDRYFGLLDDDSVIVARYVAQCAARIAALRPELQARLAVSLLAIDSTHHEPNRKDLVKADILQTLDGLFDSVPEKGPILAFAQAQLDCSSPKTRKAAKEFLKAHRQ